MFSEQFEHIIRDYRIHLILLGLALGQIVSLREWLKRTQVGGPGRKLIYLFYIIFNLGWVVTVIGLYQSPILSDMLWGWIGRPALSWQLLQILVILPVFLFSSFLDNLREKRLKRKIHSGQEKPKDPNNSRRSFLKTTGLVWGGAVLGTSAYGIYRQGWQAPKIKRVTISIDDLPNDLDGLVIAHLTDIHLGLWGSQAELDMAIQAIAKEKPDLVVVTGDMVDRRVEYAHLYREPLQRLKDVPYGIWGVLGNHDHYTGYPYQVAKILTESGLTILVDKQVNLPNLPLRLIGLDDPGVHDSWMGRGLGNKNVDFDVLNFDKVTGPPPREGDFTVLLNHRPDGFGQAARYGCKLILAGHTHGGQYQVPGYDQENLAAIFYQYSNGLYHEHGAWLNVSPGLSAVGMPFRLFAWAEASLITLKKTSKV